MRSLVRLAALLVPLTCSVGAWPDAPRGARAAGAVGTTVLTMGRSVGSPTAGHLVGGARLPDAAYLRIVPAYAGGEVRWGLGSLVGMIDRAASRVRKSHPDAVLSVGHLSRPGGGEVDRHVSHESGRDADIGFYVRNAQGKSLLADRFVAFRGDGSAPTWPGAYFDDARNWALVRALLSDPQARVTHIFVASWLRTRLLAYAAKSGAPPELRTRAALAMLQPRGSLPHDDHFHVRIACPGWQRECVEVAVRKKPALVARVPVPVKGRSRAGIGVAGVIEKDKLARPGAGAAKPELTAGQRPEAVENKKTTAPILEGAASAVGIPAARLLEPLSPHTDHATDEAIDDVDGPM